MPNFYLNPAVITDLSVKRPIVLKMDNEDINGIAHSVEDHPDFLAFREKLNKNGYICIERGWINGDSVLRPFKLNGLEFSKGDQFPCASALKIRLELLAKK